MADPTAPWLGNAVVWMVAKFQQTNHGLSFRKMLMAKGYQGEIAEFGGQVWYRVAARVAAGRGKWEARFAGGIWVGKSDAADGHLVTDVERRVLEVRTEECKNNSGGTPKC